MPERPNILVLMCDQLRGDVLDPESPCLTPNFDRLIERGTSFTRGYTPNAICSPARASFMTGLLPHNHGVLTVTHCVRDDQACLRTQHPHWAQRLQAAGYRTGYFGKWHVERSGDLTPFGWQVDGHDHSDRMKQSIARAGVSHSHEKGDLSLAHYIEQPRGYNRGLHYGVTNLPIDKRFVGIVTSMALDYLDEALAGDEPWCCFASCIEPHDPFVCGEEAFAKYDVDALDLPPSTHDDLAGRPNLYRKVGRAYEHMTDRRHREAMACYYAQVTEVDERYGRIIDRIEQAGRLDNTLVVVTSDHGELLSAHGLYCKNIGAWEEVYRIPMLLAGPGVAPAGRVEARVGLHDLAPTLCELAGGETVGSPDSRSFTELLRDPAGEAGDWQRGFAEFMGTRFMVQQRVAWDGPWKYCLNAFDFDELYNLDDDPHEMHNLIDDPAHTARAEQMLRFMRQRMIETDDRTLVQHHYSGIRAAIPLGPNIIDE